MREIVFDFPAALAFGLPLVLALASWALWVASKNGIPKARFLPLNLLRAVALILLVFLAARPVWIEKQQSAKDRKTVVLLMDKSESMSLDDDGQTRYARALEFSAKHLLPALRNSGLQAQALLFAEEVQEADGERLASAAPDGKRSNLGGAIARGISSSSAQSLAVIALTDGAANESSDNARALSALAEARVPFISVGFGSDTGTRSLSLRQVEAPPVAAPNSEFNITAHLETMNVAELPAFDLVLLRNGEFQQKKTVAGGAGSRFWLENFRVKETTEGAHTYEVKLMPPAVPNLFCVASSGSVFVRIANEKELRVLYVQGALTWDYKFIGLALRGDPTIKVTGLTRTSTKSVFRQNVESAGELLNGFPATLEQMAPYRVVVLSNLRPSELDPAQQELLARFCGELAGGLLMIGGPETFDASWRDSRLEQLLPVVFASNPGVQGLDRPFEFELTDEALQHPVFQISDAGAPRDIWSRLPTFNQYGRVDEAKPGALVWALHQSDEGPNGRRILMASQRYGAGLTAILTVQNFWRWRLAKDSEPAQFDRFWRHLFRFLGESARQDVIIHLADQELHPRMDVRVVLEKQPGAKDATAASPKFTVRAEDAGNTNLLEQSVELPPGHPVEVSFRAERPGLYTVSVVDEMKAPVATRTIEIRDINVELQNSARNMEILQQWAALSDGLAVKAEDCRDGRELVSEIQARIEKARQTKTMRTPVGMNAWTFTLLLGCLGGEWLLRKRWGMT